MRDGCVVVKSIVELDRIARRIRADVVAMSNRGGASHLGSALSCVDLLVAASEVLSIDPERPDDPDRDRLILSKGHAASALYATLAHRGFFPLERLLDFNQPCSGLPEQPSPGCVPGVEVATGSLGHGISLAAGFALSARIQGRSSRMVAIASDGEMNEGSVWEAAMFAAAQGLDRLVVVIDFNGWQATGRSRDILNIEPLSEKWASFGWVTSEVDGHDLGAVLSALDHCGDGPHAIIAHTIKGKGVSFMEDDNNWHYRIPTIDEVSAARTELLGAEESVA